MEIIKDSIAFLMPCGAGVEPRSVQSAMSLVGFSIANGFMIRQIGVTERTVVHTARNFLAAEFLRSECEWAFWMDSDMILEPRTIPVMINKIKAQGGLIGTGVYYQRLGIHKPLIFKRDPKTPDGKLLFPGQMPDDYGHAHIIPASGATGLFKCDAAGFGCFLTHRSVFDRMAQPYFRNHFQADGKEVSEDFYFCIQARLLGYDIWVVPELRCGHISNGIVITEKDFVRPVDSMSPIQIETAEPQYKWKQVIGGKA